MVSLDCNMAGGSSASSSHITIGGTTAKIQLPVHKILLLGTTTLKCCSQIDFKGSHTNGKDLLTNTNDPWAESKDLKGLHCRINFQGLKRTKRDLKDPGNLAWGKRLKFHTGKTRDLLSISEFKIYKWHRNTTEADNYAQPSGVTGWLSWQSIGLKIQRDLRFDPHLCQEHKNNL